MTTSASPPGQAPSRETLCPYCLEPIGFDERQLFVRDDRQQYAALDLSTQNSPLRRADTLRSAYQRCRNTDGVPQHYIPAPYLTHGDPLTVAMVGDSATGKTHLLTQMIAEIIDGGLERYGITWQSVNPQDHRVFIEEHVTRLRSGRMLEHTPPESFASFVAALLLSGPDGSTRPVAFFDLSGEDLRRTDAMLRFMLGVDALVFVVDPLRAVPLPHLDPLRGELGLASGGDPAFQTVLDRLPRSGPYHGVAAAVVINKSDLLRFEPPVDRWLAEPPPPGCPRPNCGTRAGTPTPSCGTTAGPPGCSPSTAYCVAPCTSRPPRAATVTRTAFRTAPGHGGCSNRWCPCCRCAGCSVTPAATARERWGCDRAARRGGRPDPPDRLSMGGQPKRCRRGDLRRRPVLRGAGRTRDGGATRPDPAGPRR